MSERLNSIFREYYADKPFIDRFATEPARAVDVITPVIHTNELWQANLLSFYREVPVHKLLINATQSGIDSHALLHYMDAGKIQTRPLWQPAHLSPAHGGMRATDCEVAERLNGDEISLPSSVGLTCETQEQVIGVVRKAREHKE